MLLEPLEVQLRLRVVVLGALGQAAIKEALHLAETPPKGLGLGGVHQHHDAPYDLHQALGVRVSRGQGAVVHAVELLQKLLRNVGQHMIPGLVHERTEQRDGELLIKP